MDPGDWRRVREVFDELLQHPPGTERRRLLERRLGDPRLRAEVVRLLRCHEDAEGFLEEPWVRLLPSPDAGGPAAGPREGDRVGAYRLVREVARGGMGVVFVAERSDDLYDKRVAVKFLSPQATSAELRERFAHEMRLLARLDHPFVARMIDGGVTEQGWPFFIMELVDGLPLDRHCEARGLDLRERLTLFAQVCRAVHSAHGAGVIHGDLKPGNVLITAEGEPRLVDFGLAEGVAADGLLPAGVRGLTPPYASPEQTAGRALTTASDIWSLGALLVELATGSPPSSAGAADVVARRIREGGVSCRDGRKALARALGLIVARATAPAPGARYASAEELAQDVERAATGAPPRAWGEHPVRRVAAAGWRHRRRLAAAAAVVAVVGAGASVLLHRSRERVELTRRFVSEAREIEHLTRVEAMLPRHDIRPYRRELRRRVTRLEAEIPKAAWAAPVSYAAGIGRLELGDHEKAAEHLQRAWDQGFRSVEVGRGLAIALSHLYRKELETARRALDPEEGAARRRAATARFGPRLASLLDRLQAIGGRDLDHVRVLADYLAGDSERAWARLRRIDPERRRPRTSVLEGHLLTVRASELKDSDPRRILELFERAGTAYARAKTIWRSDAELHLADCGRAVEAQLFRWATGAAGAIAPEEAGGACHESLEIDPGDGRARAELARLYSYAAQEDVFQGRDPAGNVRRAVEVVRRIEGDPLTVAAGRLSASSALANEAKWRVLTGGDPLPVLERAAELAEGALRVGLRDARTLNHVGILWGTVLRHREHRGDEYALATARAMEAFEAALELRDACAVRVNLGVTYQKRAEVAARSDEDPAPWLQRSAEQFRRALEATPGRAIYHERAAGIYLLQARLAGAGGHDPTPHLARALTTVRRAVELDPECGDCRVTLAEALIALAASDRTGDAPSGEALVEAEALLVPLSDLAHARELLSELRGLRRPGPAPSAPS